jgi:cytochrome c-type biogenesis protein
MKLSNVFALALLLIFAVDVYSESVVFIEFLYWDPSQSKSACPTCPNWKDAMKKFIDASNLIDDIQNEYGDQVKIERVDITTTEGSERCRQYNCVEAQTIVINHTIKLEGEQMTRENLKKVIDEYLTEEEPDKNPFQPQPLTIVGAFSLGFFDTFSPCLIAMLSFVLSYTIGKTTHFKEGILRVTTFGIGFVSAAVLLGATVALTLISMPSIQIVLMWIICIFVILFGLNLLGLLNVPVQTKPLVEKLAGKYAVTYIGLLLLGFVFYFLDPCIAPFAFTMLIMLQNSEFILPLLVFCLGAFIPFIGIGIVAGYASKLARNTYKHRSKIRAISGLILIIYALYLIIFCLF